MVLVETVAVHLLLTIFVSHLWAWMATTLAVSTAWWMWQDWKGLQENPTRIGDGGISVRLGTRRKGEIRREGIAHRVSFSFD